MQSVLKNFTSDLDILKSISFNEKKTRNCRKSRKPKFFHQMTLSYSLKFKQ